MTARSIAVEDKRRRILDAAVRVFARKGYHASRVDDIADEAAVAHGLLYHYFSSKDQLLQTVFRQTWRELVEAVGRVERSDDPAAEQLRQIAAIVLRAWRNDRDLVRVLVREIARSPHVQREVEEIGMVFRSIERIIERGQARGELRDDVDARVASWIFYGALEEILTGWVLEQLPDSDGAVERAERVVVEVFAAGLAARSGRRS